MITYTCTSLKEYIHSSVRADESIILRYCKSFIPEIDLELLESISIKEGCRIVGPVNYCGANIFFLDMASLMADGNFKSTVACVSIARSIEQGTDGLVVCSSGNTGTAIARYSKPLDIPAFIFIPKMSSYKFDFSVIDHRIHSVHIIDKPEWEVHSFAKSFANENGLSFVPSIQHQLDANACRTLFVLEYMNENNIDFHWTSQAVSGGHGPVGFYKKLFALMEEGLYVSTIPGFIGVQQEGICPMFNAWNNDRDYISDQDINLYPCDVLEPTLYSTRPEQNYRFLYNVVKENGGRFYSFDTKEYDRLKDIIVSMVSKNGIKLKTVSLNNHRVFIEKAGLLSGMGVLKAIEHGIIPPGQNALVTFTGTCEHN